MWETNLAKELKFKYTPVAVALSDEPAENALEFDPATMGGGCSLTVLMEAAGGKNVYFGAQTGGCPGSKTGLGFTDESNIPGGIEYFLSCGRGEGYPEGERLKKTPEAALKYYKGMPKNVHDAKYVSFKPLEENDDPQLVIFLVKPDQLAALVTLYTYESGNPGSVIMPMTSGCSSLVKLPLDEMRKDEPRAVVGLVDIFARPLLDDDLFAFTVPYRAFLEMEENSRDCFFQARTWNGIRKRL